MQDLEENLRILTSQKNKLKDLGDSLWHPKFRKKLKNLNANFTIKSSRNSGYSLELTDDKEA